MEPDVYEEAIAALPHSVRKRLKNCPQPGLGINPWCMRTARALVEYFEDEKVIAILEAYVKDAGRDRDISRAVSAARGYANGQTGSSESWRLWPVADHAFAHSIVIDSAANLDRLRAASSVRTGTDELAAQAVVDVLFPGNPLLCMAKDKNLFWTKPRELWRGRESRMQFIVPNAMASLQGKTKEGKDSVRCLENTGERQFLVIEFDIAEAGAWEPYVREWQARGISTFDAQAALLVHLATKDIPRFRLTMAVHSGKKSLHGWFRCQGIPEEQTRAFMVRATRIGADPATWTKCQLVRMPGGTRDDGSAQRVEYFNAGKQEGTK
jgi:hypothetical protein